MVYGRGRSHNPYDTNIHQTNTSTIAPRQACHLQCASNIKYIKTKFKKKSTELHLLPRDVTITFF